MNYDDGEKVTGNLQTRLHDQELRKQIQEADIIFGQHPVTGIKTGPYYGIAQLQRIVRRGTAENAVILHVDVDPETDDIEVLIALVQTIKGASCYVSNDDSQ